MLITLPSWNHGETRHMATKTSYPPQKIVSWGVDQG
jgi:hypothetical protein